MALQTNNAIVNWSNYIVFDGSQKRYFFNKTKFFRLQKENCAVVLSSVSTVRATKLKLETYCDHFHKDSVSPNLF